MIKSTDLRSLDSAVARTPSPPTQTRREKKVVEAVQEPRLGLALGGAPSDAPPAEKPDVIATRRALTRLLRKRVKKFVALAPQVGADANPKIVHDARVWSRRLQQAVSAFFPKPRSGKVRRLRRVPRRLRRTLGEWRNCDVLLEIVARQQQRTRSAVKRQAWMLVRDRLLQKRAKEIVRAGKKLLREELGDYAALAQKILRHPPDESPAILLQRLGDSVQEAWTEWQSALSRAQETRALGDLHAFRIATKDLRYRIELLYDVGQRAVKAQLNWLADLQDALGVWHDRQVLHQAVAEAIAHTETLLHQAQAARILLAEVEKDRSYQTNAVEEIFRLANVYPEPKEMESRSVTARIADHSPPA